MLPTDFSATDLAKLLGVTRSSISRLASDGVLPRDGHNRYPLPDSVHAYVAHLKTPQSRAGRRADAPSDPLKLERIRQSREAADKLAIQNAASRRELLPARDVETHGPRPCGTFARGCSRSRAGSPSGSAT